MTIQLVTDSTSDILPQEASELGIIIVPLTVFFGEDAYLDNVELDNATFYQKLQSYSELPRTSQPAPAIFEENYIRLIKEGATGIISVHLSAKLSGTYQSACTARQAVMDAGYTVPIEVIDSQSISAGMAIALRQAAQEAKAGSSFEEVKSNLVDRLSRTRIIAILDTLEYLRRGGRIGGAKALLGNMLSMKPIVTLKEGAVIPLEQPRTRTKAYNRATQIMAEAAPFEAVAIAESNEEVGQQIQKVLKTVYSGNISRYKLGGVLGTHTGPGTVAIITVSAKA